MEKQFSEEKYPLQAETFIIIGICMEVHRILGKGFLEIVYKDAIEYELKKQMIPYEREKEYVVPYKDIILRHKFYADFVVYGHIILEVKAQNGLPEEFEKLVLNYLTVSKRKIGLLVNFGHDSLKFKRMIV
jgi:GxxExxY protein